MERKLYIINNGLRDLRGHYFETAISIAEASRALGLRPVLAAHVACPRDIVPEGLEFHPVCTTDHWMAHTPPPAPELLGLRGELAPLLANPIEALREGVIDFDRYLEARFLPEDDPTGDEAPPITSFVPAAPPTPWVRLKRLARAILPPALQRLIPLGKKALKQATPPVLWDRLRLLLKGPPADVPEQPGPVGPPPEPEEDVAPDPIATLLHRINCDSEYEYYLRYRQDLERLLTLTGCSAGDHVFLPTAHGRELCAVLQLLSSLPEESRPTFHLEFRHALDLTGSGVLTEDVPYCAAHRAFFQIARAFPPSERLRLYTDTEGLAEEYERFSGLDFGILPIPFRSRLLTHSARDDGPLCIAYFGDVRDEKGFHWLPDLIDSLLTEQGGTGRFRFLIQGSLIHPEYEPGSRAALERLKAYPEDLVRLVGLDGPLAPDSYYDLVSEADLLLCPYDPVTYRNRSSGTLTEAIGAGIPTVVPRGTWLARQQPPGSGETFVDRESFLEAVRRICDGYAAYHARAEAGRHAWLAWHSPERLVRSLLGELDEPSSAMGKVA